METLSKEMQELIKKLMIQLDREHHPHTSIIVTSTTSEVVEGVASVSNDDLVD